MRKWREDGLQVAGTIQQALFSRHHSARQPGLSRRCAACPAAPPSNLALTCHLHTCLPPPCREAGLDGWKPPAAVQVRGSLPGYWRATRGLFSRGRAANELALLHVPQEGVTALKAMAAGERPAGGGGMGR